MFCLCLEYDSFLHLQTVKTDIQSSKMSLFIQTLLWPWNKSALPKQYEHTVMIMATFQELVYPPSKKTNISSSCKARKYINCLPYINDKVTKCIMFMITSIKEKMGTWLQLAGKKKRDYSFLRLGNRNWYLPQARWRHWQQHRELAQAKGRTSQCWRCWPDLSQHSVTLISHHKFWQSVLLTLCLHQNKPISATNPLSSSEQANQCY